jgi:acetyltransferase-like isoleucine patch superfamily enzyme
MPQSYRYDFLLFLCNRVVAILPSARFRRWFYRTIMHVKIEQGANLLSGQWLDCRGQMSIGENSVINQDCRLDARGGIKIGCNVSISPEVHLITADHDIDSPINLGRNREIIIANRVFIGTRAVILPGITIGEGAVVAACACVTKDVPPYSVVAGVPAKVLRQRSTIFTYTTQYDRHFF